MENVQTIFYIITTIVTLIGSLTAIVISIRKAPIQERREENLADKLQTENTINLLNAQRTLIEPLNNRIFELEKEKKICAEDCASLQSQLSKIIETFTFKNDELEIKIKALEIRVSDAEQYIDRLIHFIRSYDLIPPSRDLNELKKKDDGKDKI